MLVNKTNQALTRFPVPLLASTTQLRLDKNSITSIPDSISNYKLLVSLHARENQISHISPNIGDLPKLTALLLSNNKLSSIPSELGNLKQLTQLRLDNNELTEIPKEIGQLTNLRYLFLENNKITHLPEELRNLKNLIHLSLDGNPINIPATLPSNQPHDIIEYAIQNQETIIKDSLITKKAFYFTNASKDYILNKYNDLLIKFSESNSIQFTSIEHPNDITSDTNVVFIIAPIDTKDDEKLILSIAKKCKDLNIKFFILAQKDLIETNVESINLSKGAIVEKTLNLLSTKFSNEINYFNSYEELNGLIFQALKQHKPNIRLTKLSLENIGHFSDLELNLNDELTCIIGPNGTGKSTILRAIAIAIVGYDHRKIDNRARKSFLKVQNLSGDVIHYETGKIRLDYLIDGDHYTNELVFKPYDNGNDIVIESDDNNEIVYNKYNLKSLVVGFPQVRGQDSSAEDDVSIGKLTQPHVNDLIPLINNRDDFRLKSFTGWITQLYFDSIKAKDNSEETNKEQVVIDETFKIISRITKTDIFFKTVTDVSQREIWVTTADAPNGIPLNLISEGFKIVMGWIGYFMQRLVSTFPLTEPKLTFQENAIFVLDEIDTSIHPIWQSSILRILRETFPQTQFIFTTHSPLMIAGLDKDQFIELSLQNNKVIAIENQVDTWAFTYRDVLEKLFDTVDPAPKKTIEELEVLLSNTTDFNEKESIIENIKRLQESERFENETAAYELQLISKQKELEELIQKYKAKNT